MRERNGFAYTVESSYMPYSDTGVFSVYFGSDKVNFSKSLDILYGELSLLRNKKMGVQQLIKAKRQLIGQLAIASENNEALMLNVARSHMFYNAVEGFDEVNAKIENITADELLRVANENFLSEKLSTLIYT